jgi:putative transposase
MRAPRRALHGLDDLELATCDWVHYYNQHRLHSSINYLTPIEYEQAYYRENNLP